MVGSYVGDRRLKSFDRIRRHSQAESRGNLNVEIPAPHAFGWGLRPLTGDDVENTQNF